MIKIGELSRLTGLSVQAIRFYETKGLIAPVEVDRWTGYRYYDENSVKTISEILYLKNLGFTLDEIANIDEHTIKAKLDQMKNYSISLKNKISIISSLKIKGDKVVMKNFINDEKAVGKWERVGIVENKSDFANGKLLTESDVFDYKNIYFLPNGEEYYVFSWTKGYLYLPDRKLPYEIVGDIMYIGVIDYYTDSADCYAVYKRVDNKKYNKSEIRIADNTNIPFVDDLRVVGLWEYFDFIKDKTVFDPDNKFKFSDHIIEKYIFEKNGKLKCLFSNNNVADLKWSKGVVINDNKQTVSEYGIKQFGDDKYLIVEWKSGDYIYGGKVKGYYVFKKV